VLWTVQGILAAVFAGSGMLKLFRSRAELVNTLGDWAADVPDARLKLLGFVEILAALGLILPRLIGVLPVLTPLAAVGVFVVMAGAMVIHGKAREYPRVAANVVIAAAAVFVAVSRFGPYA
jgi:uncharacterized membrane protein YphA (DoxX/SURF4 family)